jgi:hypothetical protein
MIPGLSINRDLDYFSDADPSLIAQLYFRHIYRRVHTYKFNFLGMLTGKHRVAKSTTAVQMSYLLDPTFYENLEERVVYFPNDFQAALETIRKNNIIGAAIIWDEAGVGIPARDWFDLSNKSISYTLQVFGRYRPIVYFVTQDVSYIDSQARKLFHGFYEMSRMKNDFATVRPFDVRYNKRSTKVYYVYSRFHLNNDDAVGSKLILKKIKVHKPFKEMEDRYERHSKIFKDKITDQMKERSDLYSNGKIDVKRMTVEEIIDHLSKNKEDPKYLSKRSIDGHVIFDSNSIAFNYSIPARMACHVKRQAEILVNKVSESKQIVES